MVIEKITCVHFFIEWNGGQANYVWLVVIKNELKCRFNAKKNWKNIFSTENDGFVR